MRALLLHLERVWQDVRHGARVFARNPGLTAIAVLSIACGTGANVAMFSAADVMLLRPLPVPLPDDLVAVGFRTETMPGVTTINASYLDYQEVRSRVRSFEGVLAYNFEQVGFAPRPDAPPRVRFVSFTSENFFSVLGVPLALGRGFHADETSPGSPARVVVLSDAVWRGDYGGDPGVVGRTIRIRATDFTIVGVVPPDFPNLHPVLREALFLPMGTLPSLVDVMPRDVMERREARVFALKGRLRPGVTLAEARTELKAIGQALEQEFPATNTDVELAAMTELAFKMERRPLGASLLRLLMTVSVAVLCVACANVAGLFASRAPVRAREMSLRLAIGAGRARLIRQLLTETLAIALIGGAAGLLVAQAGMSVLRELEFPSELLATPPLRLDTRALAFSLLVALTCALLVGLAPALQTTRVDLAGALKASDHTPRRRRAVSGRAVLVSIQVALSLVLLTIAAFTYQAFVKELQRGPGFRTTQMAKVTVSPGHAGYTLEESAEYFSRLLADARALPGVRSASLTSAMPLFSYHPVSVIPEGSDTSAERPVRANEVDDRYFATMDIQVVAGRPFTPADHEGATLVAIVNTVLADHLWPGGEALGKRLRVRGPDDRPVTVVGVAHPTTMNLPGERPQDAIYFPYLQRPAGDMVLLAQTDGPSGSVLEALRQLAQRQDRDVPVFDAHTIERFYELLVTAQLATVVRMVTGIGMMGVALTMVGLSGMVLYMVTRRTREIGIRMAIGATGGHVMRMVLREGMAPVWCGIAVGLLLSGLTATVVIALIPTQHRLRPEFLLAVVPLMVAVTAAAAALPARYASRISPTTALRCD